MAAQEAALDRLDDEVTDFVQQCARLNDRVEQHLLSRHPVEPKRRAAREASKARKPQPVKAASKAAAKKAVPAKKAPARKR